MSECKIILLNQGFEAKVDPEDYEQLSKHRWGVRHGHHVHYAVRWVNRKAILMHRQIMKAKKGQIIDHINDDGLDNRRSNLRFCTRSQNSANSRLIRKTYSNLKGVSWDKTNEYWVVRIQKDKKRMFLGCFKDKIEAHKVYVEVAKDFHGEFARTL